MLGILVQDCTLSLPEIRKGVRISPKETFENFNIRPTSVLFYLPETPFLGFVGSYTFLH